MDDDLVARLLRKEPKRMRYGATLRPEDVWDVPINPDGLSAVAELERRRAAIERLQAELAEAVAKEREACAKVALGHRVNTDNIAFAAYNTAAENIAAAIRERT